MCSETESGIALLHFALIIRPIIETFLFPNPINVILRLLEYQEMVLTLVKLPFKHSNYTLGASTFTLRKSNLGPLNLPRTCLLS